MRRANRYARETSIISDAPKKRHIFGRFEATITGARKITKCLKAESR